MYFLICCQNQNRIIWQFFTCYSNYDDNCKLMIIDYCENEYIYKVQQNNQLIDYKENIIIDLNENSQITINIIMSQKICHHLE